MLWQLSAESIKLTASNKCFEKGSSRQGVRLANSIHFISFYAIPFSKNTLCRQSSSFQFIYDNVAFVFHIIICRTFVFVSESLL